MKWLERIRDWFDTSGCQRECFEIRLPTETDKENPFLAVSKVRRVKPWPPPPPTKRPKEADGYVQKGGGI